MLYQGHHVRHYEKFRCAFCYEFGHKQCECPMRVWRLSVGERASTSGTGRGRKRGMVGVYHTPLWLQVGMPLVLTVQFRPCYRWLPLLECVLISSLIMDASSPMWEVNYRKVTIRHIGLLCWYHDGTFRIVR